RRAADRGGAWYRERRLGDRRRTGSAFSRRDVRPLRGARRTAPLHGRGYLPGRGLPGAEVGPRRAVHRLRTAPAGTRRPPRGRDAARPVARALADSRRVGGEAGACWIRG